MAVQEEQLSGNVLLCDSIDVYILVLPLYYGFMSCYYTHSGINISIKCHKLTG